MASIYTKIFSFFLLAAIVQAQPEDREHPKLRFRGTDFCMGTEKAQVAIVCPQDTEISILSAEFGRENDDCPTSNDVLLTTSVCEMKNVKDTVEGVCLGKQRCQFSVTEGMFPRQCPGVQKYLSLEYECKFAPRFVRKCQGMDSRVTLSCNETNHVIWVVDAFWGRRSRNVCPGLSGTANTGCSAPEVTARVAALCQNKKDCELCPDSWDFDDPCRDTNKYLEVNYICGECVNYDDIETGKQQCDVWAANGECEANSPWMLSNCKKSCWGCGDANSCVDKDPDCSCMATRGQCSGNPAHAISQQCPYSCNQCSQAKKCDNGDGDSCPPQTLSTTTKMPCINSFGDDDKCIEYAETGECEINPSWMFINCEKACNVCPKSLSSTSSPSLHGSLSTTEYGDLIQSTVSSTISAISALPPATTTTSPPIKTSISTSPSEATRTSPTMTTPTPTSPLITTPTSTLITRPTTTSSSETTPTSLPVTTPTSTSPQKITPTPSAITTPPSTSPPITTPTFSTTKPTSSPITLPPSSSMSTKTRVPTTTPLSTTSARMVASSTLSTTTSSVASPTATAATSTSTTKKPTTTTRLVESTTTKLRTSTHLDPFPGAECRNQHEQCEFWAATNQCVLNPEYMFENCRPACNVCKGPPTISKTTTTTSPTPATTRSTPSTATATTRSTPSTTTATTRPTPSTTTATTRPTTSTKTASTRPSSTILTTALRDITMTESLKTTMPVSECFNSYGSDVICDGWARTNLCSLVSEICAKSCKVCKRRSVISATTTSTTTAPSTPSTPLTPSTPSTPSTTTTPKTTMTTTNTVHTTTTTTQRTVAPQPCVNAFRNSAQCDMWAEANLCDVDRVWMLRHCYKSCMKCVPESETTATTQSTTTDPDCFNVEGDLLCEIWERSNRCNTQDTVVFMRRNCAKTCGFCNRSTLPRFTSTFKTTKMFPKTTQSTTSTMTMRPTTTKALQISCTERCVKGVCNSEGQCTCSPGWTGVNCEGFRCEAGCNDHGSCAGPDACACDSGWSGNTCDEPICQSGCSGKGICIAPNRCLCQPYWGGDDCSQCGVHGVGRACLPCPPCLHGACVSDGENTIRSFIGCFADPELSDLEYVAWRGQGSTTIRKCVQECHRLQYRYAGLQNGNECRCGNIYGRRGASGSCTVQCQGGVPQEICGGSAANSIYKVHDGICQCNPFYGGRLCDRCSEGFTGGRCQERVIPTNIPTPRPASITTSLLHSTSATTPTSTMKTTTKSTTLKATTRVERPKPAPYNTTTSTTTASAPTTLSSAPTTIKTSTPSTRASNERDPNVIPDISVGSPVESVQSQRGIGSMNLTLVLPKEKWHTDYLNIQSTRAIELISKTEVALTKIYSEDVKEVQVLRLRNGSVVVDYKIVFDQEVGDSMAVDMECFLWDKNETEMIKTYEFKLPNEIVDMCKNRKSRCKNSGVLSRKQDGHYYCKCTDEYDGEMCEINIWKRTETIIIVVFSAFLPILGIFIFCCCVFVGRRSSSQGDSKTNLVEGYDTGTAGFKYQGMDGNKTSRDASTVDKKDIGHHAEDYIHVPN